MKYLQDKFSIDVGSESFREGWDRIFGKNKELEEKGMFSKYQNMSRTLNEWVAHVHETAVEKGWYEGISEGSTDHIKEKLLLIHSEVSEATEDFRVAKSLEDLQTLTYKGSACDKELTESATVADRRNAPPVNSMLELRKPEGFPSEMADIVIRVMDLCASLGIDLEFAIKRKAAYNATRPHRHGGKNC